MDVWLMVALAGAAGGLAATLTPTGCDFRSPSLVVRFLGEHHKCEFLYHLIRNAIFGMFASLVVTAAVYDTATLVPAALPRILALAFVTGGPGLAIVNSLFRQADKTYAVNQLKDTVRDLLPDTSEEAANESPGGDSEPTGG